jgi:NADH-quinone oxidoreductase subunit N
VANIDLLAVGPEILLLLAAVAVLTIEVTTRAGHRPWAWIAGFAYSGATVLAVIQWLRLGDEAGVLAFSSRAAATGVETPMIVTDGLSAFAGIVIFTVIGVGLAGAWDLVVRSGTRGAELVALVMLSTAGLHLMTASANLVFLFLALEIGTISLYVVAGFIRGREDTDEAAMKYFLLGSFSSALFLYGVALAFAATGSTSIYGTTGIRSFLAGNVLLQPGVLLAGIGLLIVGLGFKVSAAPFHMWAPDVYQGAPTGAVGLMAAGVKVAGFAAIARVLVGAFPGFIADWAPAVAVLAALSVIVGTALAIAQTDLKRMLAYSSVAHAGFMLTALVAGGDGVPSLLFYLATYAFQLVGAFAVISVVEGSLGGKAPLTDYAGLGARSPVLAATLGVFMLAMGGIPFTAGFVGKAAVFTSALDAGYLWLVILALIASVAGLFFYLRVIVLMYMQVPELAEGPGAATAVPEATGVSTVVLGVSVAVTLAFGVVPWPLLRLVADALPL